MFLNDNLCLVRWAFLAAAIIFGGHCPCAVAAEQPKGMIELTVEDRRIEGQPLSWNATQIHLLGRDGRLWDVSPDEVADYRRTAAEFRPFSPSEYRAALLRELGAGYEVSGTSHYLVAHPSGQRDRWAERFEELYREFVAYFSRRGLQPSQPPFPLVGVVLRDRGNLAQNIEGYYDLKSTRIFIYDMGGRDDSPAWRQNAAVLIHEATHQTAFNTGVHSRYSPPPRWLAEGLAMYFEAPGVHDARNHGTLSARINQGRLQAFRRLLASGRRPEDLAAMVAGDELFQTSPAAAYAQSWALYFYLSENEPARLMAYLRRTAAVPPFQPRKAAQRLADFTAVFGSDWRMLDARLNRFIAGL